MNIKRLFDIGRWRTSRSRRLEEIDEEFEFHLEQRALDREADGLAPADARHDAEQRFGDKRRYREQGAKALDGHARGQARASFVDGVAQDLGFAIRSLRRRPGFAAAAVLTLALSIGANSAMFSVIKTVIMAPLPFASPDRVVQVWDSPPDATRPYQMPMGNVREYMAGSDVFSHVGLVHSVNLYGEQGGRVEYVAAQHISADLFHMMRVGPMAGRTFRTEEDSEGVGELVILTHAYWQKKFGDQDVIGLTLPLRVAGSDWQELEYEIIGILPPDFKVPSARQASGYGVPGPPVSERFWTEPDVILPLGLDWAHEPRYAQRFFMFAQLRDGVTPEQARLTLQPIADGMGESDRNLRGREVAVVPVEQVLLKEYGAALGFLWAATALLLLVACASVSSLLLGWGVAREQELAVRGALGAGARRIFSQLLTEATAIGLAAGVLGVPLAYLGIAAVKLFAPAGVHRLDEIGLDASVLGFTIGVSLTTVVLVGLWPALRGARQPSSDVLKAGGRGSTLARTRSLRVLVTVEVALSLLLLAGAGLMLQSFWNLMAVDTGVAGERVVHVSVRVPLPEQSRFYDGPPRDNWWLLVSGPNRVDWFRFMRDRIGALPGVTSFASSAWDLGPEGRRGTLTTAGGNQLRGYVARWVSPGFFRTMGIPLLQGGTWEESRLTTPVRGFHQLVISADLARKLWPGENPVGKIFYGGDRDPDEANAGQDAYRRIRAGDAYPDGPHPREVIGVVADASITLGQEPVPTIYRLQTNAENFFIRTASDGISLASLRREIDAIDPSELEVSRIRTLEQFFAEGGTESRFRALLVVFFAVIGTGITCLGLFGVLTYSVAQRTRELGIRVTLGAARSDIVGLVLGQGVRMVGLGVVIGIVLLIWATRYISSLLFGVAPLDPTTLVGVTLLIFGLSMLATYLPARRAMGVDPIDSLREA